MRLMLRLRSRFSGARKSILDHERRVNILFSSVNMLLCLTAAVMAVVNIFTAEWLMLCTNIIFASACMINIRVSTRGKKAMRIVRPLFCVEGLVLCTFFCVSGTPEGFSAFWFCFIPSFSFTLLGIKRGFYYTAAGFVILVLLFWLPFGRAVLQYEYTASFILRFPLFYLAFSIVALFLEFVRHETYKQLRISEQYSRRLSLYDALTKVHNRYGFNEEINRLYPDPEAKTLSILFLDIDHFKQVNDRFGHIAGDTVLAFIAKRIEQTLDDKSSVSRWGGEEFTVLLANHPDPCGLAERIRADIENTVIPIDGETVSITVTIGVCTVTDRSDIPVSQFIMAADKMLYAAKDAGRNRVKGIDL